MTTSTVPQLLGRIQQALNLNQRELAELMECSRRTIIRYYQRGGALLPSTWESLARATHGSDRQLAAELAVRAGHTLVSLGLEPPPPLPAPALASSAPAASSASPAPAAPLAHRDPSLRHLADSVVCAAAEAVQTTPQAMRPALLAAFERAVALELSAKDMLDALSPDKAVKGGKSAKA